jgi:hypothetical protein
VAFGVSPAPLVPGLGHAHHHRTHTTEAGVRASVASERSAQRDFKCQLVGAWGRTRGGGGGLILGVTAGRAVGEGPRQSLSCYYCQNQPAFGDLTTGAHHSWRSFWCPAKPRSPLPPIYDPQSTRFYAMASGLQDRQHLRGGVACPRCRAECRPRGKVPSPSRAVRSNL